MPVSKLSVIPLILLHSYRATPHRPHRSLALVHLRFVLVLGEAGGF